MGSTYSSLHYHIVFSTKDRAPLIHSEWQARLHGYLGGTVRGLGGVPNAVGGVGDHVHLLVGLKTTHCIANFMRDLKTRSSVWTQENLEPGFGWQDGYAVFTVGGDALEAVNAYIKRQDDHHRRRSYVDELRSLLEEAKVEYDERFLV